MHEPFWVIFAHTFLDYWHFDAKFIQTLLPLLFRPGFLTNKWKEGKRVRYVHPVQLYFFVSVVFFLFYFSLNPINKMNFSGDDVADSIKNSVRNIHDSLSASKSNFASFGHTDTVTRHLSASLDQYKDSVNHLPSSQRPVWYKVLQDEINIEIAHNEAGLFQQAADDFFHNLPKMMFILLPVFALILKLLYIRRKVYFIDHAVFTLHVHSFFFLAMLLYGLVSYWLHFPGIFSILIFLYLFLAMRKVYRQGIFKTFIKMLLLLFAYIIPLVIVVVIDVLLSLYQVST